MRSFLAAVAALGLATLSAASATLDEKLAPCLACHGEKGQSENLQVPSLGGQPKDYLLVQLYIFRENMRKVELMNEMAKGLTDDELRGMSEALAKLPAPMPMPEAMDPARMERAKTLVTQNHCNFCHAPTFAGQDQIPRLAGQREDYLLKSLREYKSGARPGYEPAMASVVQPMKDEDFVELAYYLARVK
jgi:cytochrome c553